MPKYGGFAMPDERFFYLSSMYSDKLLTEFLPKVKNQAYQRYIQIQKNILGGNEVFGSLKENPKYKYFFKTSNELNELFGFPPGSVYADITEQDFNLDIIDKLKFLKKFKSYNVPISSNDIDANPDIFSHSIKCMIGDYVFNKFYILTDKYHRVFIGIKNHTTDGINSIVWDRLISDGTDENPTTFCLWKDKHAAMYTYNGSISSILFSSTSSGMKQIAIPKTNTISPVKPVNENNWVIGISYNTTRYSNYLYAITNAALVSETTTNLIFDVPSKFVDDIRSRNVNVACIAMQRPNRKAIYAYSPSESNEPWLALGDNDRPVSINNVKIYTYDDATCRYKKRIPIEVNNFNQEFNEKIDNTAYDERDFFANVIFPSIYKFDNITTPIRIELIEFTPNVSNTTFDNNLKCLFTYNGTSNTDYSPDNYLEYLTWLNTNKVDPDIGTYCEDALNRLINFNPINVYMDHADYLKSGVDLRTYKFGKLLELIASDPYIYAEYIKFMDRENFNIIRESGSPKHFKIRTNITSDPELSGTNPYIRNDEFTCIVKNDEVFYFTNDTTYITVHSSNPNAFCAVYIGGRYIHPVRVKSKLNDIYIFLDGPTVNDYINKALYRLNTNPNNDDNTGLSKYNLITVEVYNNVDRNTMNQIHSSVVVDSTTTSFKLFDGDPNFKFKLSDLVIYNKSTGKYIPLNKFDISASLQKAVIEFNDGTSETYIGTTDDIIYMGTNLGEFYMTNDNYKIILGNENKEVTFPTDDPMYGKENNYAGFVNKVWRASDLKFTVTDSNLIGSEIDIIYSPVAYAWEITKDRLEDDGVNFEYQLGGFIGNNNPDNYELYLNGEYIPSDMATLTLPDGIGTSQYIKISINVDTIRQNYDFEHKQSRDNYKVQLIYNPTTYKTEETPISNIIRCDSQENELTIFNTMLYKHNDLLHYFNSDNSKVYSSNSLYYDLDLSLPYTWYENDTKIDLQDQFKVSYLHPVLNNNPILKDLNRDMSFTDSASVNLSHSCIDNICDIVITPHE